MKANQDFLFMQKILKTAAQWIERYSRCPNTLYRFFPYGGNALSGAWALKSVSIWAFTCRKRLHVKLGGEVWQSQKIFLPAEGHWCLWCITSYFFFDFAKLRDTMVNMPAQKLAEYFTQIHFNQIVEDATKSVMELVRKPQWEFFFMIPSNL